MIIHFALKWGFSSIKRELQKKLIKFFRYGILTSNCCEHMKKAKCGANISRLRMYLQRLKLVSNTSRDPLVVSICFGAA